MSESIHIEELRKEIENLCGNCDRPDKEELGKIILSSMALGFNEGLKVLSADRLKHYCAECKFEPIDKRCMPCSSCTNNPKNRDAFVSCEGEKKGADENPLAGIEPKPIPTKKHTFVYRKGADDGK